ncbi:alpha/beta hydrolase [Hyphomicrobium sp.]|uniref:alpha/beta hydrolase n=1 Tax=Hyphomicrobium sp. TaxID=82 RepID=UPI002E37647C|nr:alpha/beta hydrolase [Hyphomicrobium sp.]HEX2842923.1 alpha/beta hydrolase [Hyphomicrobium sp.]
MGTIFKIAAGVLLAMGLLATIVPIIQRKLMYHPDTTYFTPQRAGLSVGVEERVIQTPDGERVLAWYARAKPGLPTILYFHGNAGSLETRIERIRKYMARGLGVFMMTYRGFGGSTGQPSEVANVADAKLAYDQLAALGVDPVDIIIYGESLGTGVAVQVAAARSAAGLVLDAPYTSMVDLAALHYPYIPGRWFMTDRYDTRTHIKDVKAPLLILHGELDDIVPVTMGREIFNLAQPPKVIRTFQGAGHADHYLFGSYDALYGWIDDLRRGRYPLQRQG